MIISAVIFNSKFMIEMGKKNLEEASGSEKLRRNRLKFGQLL